MRSLVLIFLLLAQFTHADFVIEQKIRAGDENITLTTRIKGDLVRMDGPVVHAGDSSVIINLKTGEVITLNHNFQSVEKSSVESMKKDAVAEAKISGAPRNSGQALPAKATGKKEKIGKWDTEIFEIISGKEKTRLWVAKDFPNYKAILENLQRVADAIGRGAVFDPLKLDLGGLVIKCEQSMPGKGKAAATISILVEAKEEAVDEAIFKSPADYQPMDNPDFVIEEDIDSPSLKGKVTIRLKDNFARADLPKAPAGEFSLRVNLTKDEFVLLKHTERAAQQSSLATYQKSVAATQPLRSKIAAFPKPASTGKNEKMGAWNTEIFESVSEGSTLRLWITKAFSSYQPPLQERLGTVTSLLGDGIAPYQFDLGGVVIKWEVVMASGEKASATISSIKEDRVDDTDIQLPEKYQLTDLPGAFVKDEFLIEQLQKGSDNGDESTTIKIKGDLMRVDVGIGAFSYIIDPKKREAITLHHAEKVWSTETIEEDSESMNIMRGFVRSKLKKPATTGKKQKIGRWDTVIFEAKFKKGTVRLWVAKDFPNYNQLREKLTAMNAAISDEYDPHQFDLGGMVVKAEAPGSTQDKVTTTFTKFSEEGVDNSLFNVPAAYEKEKIDCR